MPKKDSESLEDSESGKYHKIYLSTVVEESLLFTQDDKIIYKIMKEKQIKINDLNVNYKEIGDGNTPIILLHGWGIDSGKYIELMRWLNSPEGLWSQNAEYNQSQDINAKRLHGTTATMEPTTFKIIIPDLPGFGKSDEPNENWNLNNYVEFTDKFIKNVTQTRGFELLKNILKKSNIKDIISGGFSSVSNAKVEEKKKVILIGHSFGGRIAIKYAVKYPDKIEKLILTGAAGIKHSLSRKQKILYVATKTGKTIFSLPVINKFQKYAEKFLYKIIREKDYRKASLRMKEIMKKVLAEDLTPILEKIKTTTLLLWGRLDNSTPLSDGKLMNEKIENSELVIFDDANHSLPYQKPEEFTKDIIKFIKK